MSTLRTTVRAAARYAALDVLGAAQHATGGTARALQRPRVHFVYLHAVPPPQRGRFERLVDELLLEHTPIGYSEAVQRVLVGDIDRPYLSFSFDDAFASCAATGEVLARRGVSACFFLPTGFVGCSSVSEARRFFRTGAGVDEAALSWAQVESLLAAGHEVGNHTVTHPDLAQVSLTQLLDEIEGAAAVVRSRLGSCAHFAWPLGRWQHFNATARDHVWRAGHTSCASAERGAHVRRGHRANPAAVCIRRDQVMADWPWRQVRFFLARGSARAAPGADAWPVGWEAAA